MSFFKSRSGGSLFRFRAITGYVKMLFNRKEDISEKVENTMQTRYKIEG